MSTQPKSPLEISLVRGAGIKGLRQALVACAMMMGLTCAAGPGENLVTNGGFENDGQGWRFEVWNDPNWPNQHGGQASGEIVETTPFEGKRCGMVHQKTPGTSQWIHEFTTEPNCVYRISCMVRTEGPIRAAIGVYDPSVSVAAFGTSVGHTEGWTKVEGIFNSGVYTTFAVWCRIFASLPGKAYFDNVVVEKIDAPPVWNAIMNSSFEIDTVPGFPDSWDNRWGGFGDGWRIDKKIFFHGASSLRAEWPNFRTTFLNVWKDSVCTFSLYVKGDSDGYPMEINFDGEKKIINVTSEWKRYFITKKLSGGSVLEAGFSPPWEHPHLVWVDAVQVELGGTASPYQPSPMDARAAAESAKIKSIAITARQAPDIATLWAPVKSSSVDANGLFLLNGKPFFVYGFYACAEKSDLASQKNLGYNSGVVGTGERFGKKKEGGGISIDFKKLEEYLDTMAELKMYAIPTLAHFYCEQYTGLPKGTPDLEGIKEVVSKLKNHPAILAWEIGDEPCENKFLAEAARKVYDTVKRCDPSRAIYIVQWSLGECAKFKDACDIQGTDPYPIATEWSPVDYVINHVKGPVEMYKGQPKSVWTVLQAFRHLLGRNHREPTVPELRAMTYVSLVYGTKGILNFYGVPEAPVLRDTITGLSKEVAFLSPILLSASPTASVKATPGSVHACVRKKDGIWYVVVINASVNPCGAVIDLKCDASPKKNSADVIFEKRSVPFANGQLKDHFQGYDTHVYAIPE